MIFNNDGHIGISREGTVSNPIIVEGCTSVAFANFLGSLNHKYVSRNSHINYWVLIYFIFGILRSSWAAPRLEHQQQLLDILHISHMWEIVPGINFAAHELLGFDLQPAHCLYLARRYNLVDWIPAAVWVLLSIPLEQYHDGVEILLDVELYMLIAKAKESISLEQRCYTFKYPKI